MYGDPRVASSTVLADAPGVALAGDEIVRVEPVMLDGRQILVPSSLPGASEYRAVTRAERTADDLRSQIPGTLDTRGDIPTADVRVALDFAGSAATALASAAVGLESYANFHLRRLVPDGEHVTLPDGRDYTLHELRNLPLNLRFERVLPALLDRPKPTSEPWWPDLRRVQSLAAIQRHGITEPHSRSGLEGKRSLAQRLYNGEYRRAAPMMLEAFEFFTPGWIDPQRREALARQ